MMAGLRRICKMYGGMTVDGKKFVWDYAADEPVPADEMKMGSDRWKASERARHAAMFPHPHPQEDKP